MGDSVSIKQAYMAMYHYLEKMYTIHEFDQLGGLLGGMTLLADGSPADPAAWSDWLASVHKAVSEPITTQLG